MKTIPAKVRQLADKLENSERINFLHTRDWKSNVPPDPGIYIIWRKNGSCAPIYIGEIVNLLERFSDLHRTANHTFRRHILNNRRMKGNVIKGSELSGYISNNFSISYITVLMGRAEVEEYLIYKWRKKE